jgi:hypothetical protein
MRLSDAIYEDTEDIQSMSSWAAKPKQDCPTCERWSSVQIYFNPQKVQTEYTLITDKTVTDYLKRLYKLPES